MNIIVQTTGWYASYLIGKSESPNKTLANITRAIILKSGHKGGNCFDYQYYISLSRRTENIFHDDVPYFLWNETIPLYKHIKYGV